MGICYSCLEEQEDEIIQKPKNSVIRESIKSNILSVQQQENSNSTKAHQKQQEKEEDNSKTKENKNVNNPREGSIPGAGKNNTLIDARNPAIRNKKPFTFSAPPAKKKKETNNKDEEYKNVVNP